MNEQPVSLSGLTPREAVMDAYYRIAWAFDLNDWPLFASSWTTKTDPRFHIDEWGLHYNDLSEIREKLFHVVCGLDTQHIATNARVHLDPDGKSGRMWMMCLNQHFRKGQEAKTGSARLWGGNRYMFDVVEEEGVWKIKEWWVQMGWHEGDLSILGK